MVRVNREASAATAPGGHANGGEVDRRESREALGRIELRHARVHHHHAGGEPDDEQDAEGNPQPPVRVDERSRDPVVAHFTSTSHVVIRVLVPQVGRCRLDWCSTNHMWTLQSIDPADAELMFRLLPGTLKTMGRANGVDFVVDAALVSRVHCRLTLSEANELELEDLGSTNGTFVNGKKVVKVTLSDGDKLTVGRVEFVVNAESNDKRAGSPKTTWSV